ncbi:hypothetical protein A2996_01485 [Candidatus Campbellbacteria bacterium RIFCSPLOWO2_01_FULL_34_15]|uniref:Band 7 domain-containing protein n=1 Tax=Candidatus Campbellbacteria bacterium RIFCSPLOWO2_01_FULL_34_15 TaxID=1797579 RepID=A0A1F5EPC8_9BACT|nr:MAG: hypothetical protein A2996_01485 [Candidatus Campbellbacteria bacterium RIFCSPLOWO2_01_FULL_34_15]
MKNFFRNAWSLRKKGLGFIFVKRQPTPTPTPTLTPSSTQEPSKAKKPIKRLYTFLIGMAFNAGLIFVATIIVTNFTGGFTIRGIIASVLAALAILMVFGWNGIREIQPVHVGVPMILGDLSDLFLLPGGYSWLPPEPIMDFVEVSLKEKTMKPDIKGILSSDNKTASIDAQIQFFVSNPYIYSKVDEPDKALEGLVGRNVRWLANMVEVVKLPGVKGLFSDLLEGTTLDKIVGHDSTDTDRVVAEALALGLIKDSAEDFSKIHVGGIKETAEEWGLTIKKAMVTEVGIPQEITKANAEKDVEMAQRKSESVQNRTLLDLMKEFKVDFPDLSDEKIADLIQVERKKAIRVIIDGNAGDFTKGAVAGAQITGGNP